MYELVNCNVNLDVKFETMVFRYYMLLSLKNIYNLNLNLIFKINVWLILWKLLNNR